MVLAMCHCLTYLQIYVLMLNYASVESLINKKENNGGIRFSCVYVDSFSLILVTCTTFILPVNSGYMHAYLKWFHKDLPVLST